MPPLEKTSISLPLPFLNDSELGQSRAGKHQTQEQEDAAARVVSHDL